MTPQTMNLLLVPVLWSGTPDNFHDLNTLQLLCGGIRNWYTEVTYGQVLFVPSVAPPVRVNFDGLARGVSAGDNLPNDCKAGLAAKGYTFGPMPTNGPIFVNQDAMPIGFDRVLYITPRTCSFPSGENNGWWSWLNCANEGQLVFDCLHELGHSFGLGHAAAARGSVVQRADGTLFYDPNSNPDVDWTGDGASVMSYQHRNDHFSAPDKALAGWLTPIVWTGGDHTYTLRPLEQYPDGLWVKTDQLGIPFDPLKSPGPPAYWVEYRRPIGTDADINNTMASPAGGVEIRVGQNSYPGAQYILPGNYGYGITAPARWTDGQVAIDIVSADDNGAVVRVRPSSSVVAAPPIQPQGVSQVALVQSIQTAASALVAGSITQVQIDALKASVNLLVPDAVGMAVANAGFETPALPGGDMWTPGKSFIYTPTNAGWTFTGTCGIARNAGGFTASNPNSVGSQVAFLQNAGSKISQSITFTAGQFTLSFQAAQRGSGNQGVQTIDVRIDGVSFGKVTPSGAAYQVFSIPLGNMTAGAHTLDFIGAGVGGADFTALLDDVKIS